MRCESIAQLGSRLRTCQLKRKGLAVKSSGRDGAKAALPYGRVFNIVVGGAVSAGKTTVLNALLGKEILYSSNEPATATHIQLRHRPQSQQLVSAGFGSDGGLIDFERGLDPLTLKRWNACESVHRIHVRGDLGHVAGLRRRVDLHDVPGANNSLDPSHWNLAIGMLNTVPWDMLCFVLDATAPATQDEANLLKQVHLITASRPHASVLFILNKVDALDPAAGESIETLVAHTRERLLQLGFNDPWLVPTMARVALIARLQMTGHPLSSRQAMTYRVMLSMLPAAARSIFAVSHVPRGVIERLQPELQSLCVHDFSTFPADPTPNFPFLSASATASGLRLVEEVIQHCIF